MTENLKDRIDIVIAGIHQRIPGGGTWPVHEALAELRRLAGVAWEEGFQAGRDGALRPSNPLLHDPLNGTPHQRCQAHHDSGAQCLLDAGHGTPHEFRHDTAAVWDR